MKFLLKSLFVLGFLTVPALPVLGQKSGIAPDLLRKAKAGDAQSQLALGEAYLSGTSVVQDSTQAASWLHKAADQGLAQAQYEMGTLYEGATACSRTMFALLLFIAKVPNRGTPSPRCT